ncbi:MAG: sugar ABC transporter permease [Nitrospirae bacterium]|nr:MAG: sugar ABC transporter permease [Nitrospirota bacterium]
MAAPAAAGLLAFVLLPFLAAVGLSFTDLRLVSPVPAHFVGGEEYRRVLADPLFRRAVANNLRFAAAVVPLQTGLALLLALALRPRLPGRGLARALFFLPVLLPMALVAVVWGLLLAPGPGGAVNALLAAATFGAWTPRDFLHDPAWALPAIVLLSVWQGVGFQMVVLLAGLERIPASLYEAARVDGAGPWGRFRHVTLPGLAGPLAFVVLATTLLALRLFDQVQILTRGGPRGATTTVVYEAVVAAFERGEVGRGAAMTVLFCCAAALLAAAQHRLLAGRGR